MWWHKLYQKYFWIQYQQMKLKHTSYNILQVLAFQSQITVSHYDLFAVLSLLSVSLMLRNPWDEWNANNLTMEKWLTAKTSAKNKRRGCHYKSSNESIWFTKKTPTAEVCQQIEGPVFNLALKISNCMKMCTSRRIHVGSQRGVRRGKTKITLGVPCHKQCIATRAPSWVCAR